MDNKGRITCRMDDGVAYVQSETGTEGVGYFTTQRRIPDMIVRLAAYEDTGLMPDEIEALKQREQFLTEAYDRNAKVHEALTRDYLAAKRDIKRMLQDTDIDGFCVYCQHLYREACDGCEDAEWRGPQEGANE